MSLSAMAAECGITKGMLSQIETGRAMPTLQTLEGLLKVLDLSFTRFFHAVEAQEESFLQKKEERTPRESGEGVRIWELGRDRRDMTIDPALIELRPTAALNAAPRDGKVFLYVISGTAAAKIGEKEYKAERGDTFTFPAVLPLSLKNSSEEMFRVLCVVF